MKVGEQCDKARLIIQTISWRLAGPPPLFRLPCHLGNHRATKFRPPDIGASWGHDGNKRDVNIGGIQEMFVS